MSIELRSVDKQHKGETWLLDLDGEKAVFKDPTGKVIAEVAPQQAVAHFQMPSFSENIKYFGLRAGDKLLQFDVSKPDLKKIKDFVNRTILAKGPEAIRAVRNRAIRDSVIGVACTVGGVVVTIAGYAAAASNPQGEKYTIFYGLALFGLIMIGKGIVGFGQYRKLEVMAQSTTGPTWPST